MFFHKEYISFKASEDAIKVADQANILPIVVDEGEHKRVHRVAKDLQKDIEKVTGQKPALQQELPNHSAIIVATVENTLVEALDIDVTDLKGKWESFIIETIQDVETGEDYLAIIGSDTRGAIFGVYDFTEKIGVSPWYWWMDVPVKKQEAIYVKKGRYEQGEPSIQYRGFFLNDEGPALMTWVRTHFPDFTHEFYEKIFELTLRLKANYHWPAMWDSTFYEDDPLNIVKADEYGVVIGTSHHEPMDRPHGDWKKHKKGPWDYVKNKDYLQQFWKEGIERSKAYETIPNLGMRGDGDMPMGGELSFKEKIQLMETIIKDQQGLIQEVMGEEGSIEEIPQMWALYKEVKEYYDEGMEVPEEVTLLWGDDNWGNIRRLPTKVERKRKGGAGIYYHFDYVGAPRSYKWINSVPIQKTWEQMHKAYEYDARKVWIVNVGDLKPMEFQTEFFLKLAWNVPAFTADNLWAYSVEWAENTFGEKYGERIAQIIRGYSKWNGRLKPELINAVDLYSWENEFEAERILSEMEETVQQAEVLLEELPDQLKDAYYQVAYYPARASYVVLKLQLMCDLSKALAKKGLPAANLAANEAERLFEEDKALAFDYNKRYSFGKWDHLMDQVHIGYTYWNQPDDWIMPEVSRVAKEEYQEGEWVIDTQGTTETDCYSKKSLVVDVYNKSESQINLEVATDNDWLRSSKETLDVTVQGRIHIRVDWDKAPMGEKVEGTVVIKDALGKEEKCLLSIHNPEEKIGDAFVPVDGVISIEAENFSRKKETSYAQFKVIPDYGRTQSSVAVYPVEWEEKEEKQVCPTLEYDVYLKNSGELIIEPLLAPSLPFDPKRDVRLGVAIDDKEPLIITPGNLYQNGEQDSEIWSESVTYNIHHLRAKFNDVKAGKHTVKLTVIDPQVVIQKVLIHQGERKSSYLGPVPTPHANELENYQAYEPGMKEDYVMLPGKMPFIQKAVLVYVEKAGWYQFESNGTTIDLETIDGLNAVKDTNEGKESYFLSAGTHILHVEEAVKNVEAICLKESQVTIRPTFRIQETQAENKEWIVQVGLHNQDTQAIEYSLIGEINHLPFIVADRFGTKGVLKTDEQQLHTFTFLNEEVVEAIVLNTRVTIDGWERTELFEFSFA